MIRELDKKCCSIKDLTLSIGRLWLSPEKKVKLSGITMENRFMAFHKFLDMIGRTQDDLLCAMDLEFYNDNEDRNGRKFALTIKNGVMNVKYAFRLKEKYRMVLPPSLGSIAAATDKKM